MPSAKTDACCDSRNSRSDVKDPRHPGPGARGAGSRHEEVGCSQIGLLGRAFDDAIYDALTSALPRRALAAIAAIVGLSLVAIAIVYWALPADSLPSWLPGHKLPSNPEHGHHHKRHGLTAFLPGLACLVFAWFLLARNRDAARRRSH